MAGLMAKCAALIIALLIKTTFIGADQFLEEFHNRLYETIENAHHVPGLQEGQFDEIKAGVISYLDRLIAGGVVDVKGDDKDFRPYFVSLQGIVEHVLSQGYKPIACITTPMPATPLCTKGDISKELVDPAVESDPNRLFTIKARATILRDYLYQGGILYVMYPEKGLGERSLEQQAIYKNEVSKNEGRLFDCPLSCESIDKQYVGAFYIFGDYVFILNINQANATEKEGRFRLGLGKLDDASINKWLKEIQDNVMIYSPVKFPMTF